jgi:multiple sugar transport system permease protein
MLSNKAIVKVLQANRILRLRRNINQGTTYVFLIVLSVPFVFPFWWMLTSSLKSSSEILAKPTLIPQSWEWSNFSEVFTYQPFAQHYFNSVYIALAVTFGTLTVASMAGYGFARIRFWGNSILFLLLLSSILMPVEVTIIPLFYMMNDLGLINSHVPLIIIPIFSANGVLATFLMRQFFLDFPREIEEAAMLDGLSRFGIFWRIALPLARPALGAVAILSFLFSWNSFLEPLVFINDLDEFTLPLSLNNFNDAYGLPLWHLQLAATTLSVIPIIIVYLIAQRQIVATMARSGIK